MTLEALVGALLGLFVGPFLAAVADWVPDSDGPRGPWLHCPDCSVWRRLATLLPVPSSMLRRGDGLVKLSRGRDATIVTSAVVGALLLSSIGLAWQSIPVLFVAGSAIVLSVVDLGRYRLPDRVIFPSIGVTVLLLVGLGLSTGTFDHTVRGVVVMVGSGVLLLVAHLVMPAGLAFGDVKLGLLLGLLVGWVPSTGIDAARLVVAVFLIGSILGVLTGVAVGMGRKAFGPTFLPDPDVPYVEPSSFRELAATASPFGPALCLGAFFSVLIADTWLVLPTVFG